MTATEQDVAARGHEAREWFEVHKYKCRALTALLDQHLGRVLGEAGARGPQIESRTKTVDSFVAKASKIENGVLKYKHPHTEIKDMVGLRVVVPLSTDQAPVVAAIREAFEVEEELEHGDEAGIDAPGYRSIHLVVRIEEDHGVPALHEYAGMSAEIQVRTILQHAWASLQHDLGYKSDRPVSPAVRRRLTALAGLIELADREFVDVRATHLRPTPRPTGVDVDRLGGPVTAASMRLLSERLIGEDPLGQEWFARLAAIIREMGVASVEDLVAHLGPWASRAPAIHEVVMQDRPWANTAVTFDLLLRLAMPEQYVERAESLDESEVAVHPDGEVSPVHAFQSEMQAFREQIELES